MKTVALLLLAACGGGTTNSQMTNLPDPAGPAEIRPNGFTEQVLSGVRGIPMYVTVKGLLLRYDESVEAEEIIGAWASAQGITVLPPKKTSLVLRRALDGKHVTTGAACGAPLFEFEAVERWKTELAADGKLEVRVACSPDCMMQVAISIGTGGQRGTEFFAAPFDPTKPWRDELKQRLPTIVDNGGHNQHGHMNNPVAIKGVAREANKADVIDDDAKRGTLDPQATAAVQKCVTTNPYAAVFVEYDGAGKLARCESAPESRAGATDCVCGALANRTGTANTRERFDISRASSGVVAKSKSGLTVDASARSAMTTDPAIEHWDPPERYTLSPCFADSATDTPIEGRATVEFDAAGIATKATIVAMKGAWTPQQHACLVQQFMAVRVPCPSAAGAAATAEIKVAFEK